MSCTVAAIVAFLGYMPPKGTEIVIPQEYAARYSTVDRLKAMACARRHGIRWRIAG